MIQTRDYNNTAQCKNSCGPVRKAHESQSIHFSLTQKSDCPVRLAYQPPATSTFLSNKPATNKQSAILFFQNKSAPTTTNQPNEQADMLRCIVVVGATND
jgi:hypothetical protein